MKKKEKVKRHARVSKSYLLDINHKISIDYLR